MNRQEVLEQEDIRLIAMRLYRIVHGPGDCGSEREYHCQNPAMKRGWERLARYLIKMEAIAAHAEGGE